MGSVVNDLHLFAGFFERHQFLQRSLRIGIAKVLAVIVVGVLERRVSADFRERSFDPVADPERDGSLFFQFLHLQLDRNVFHVNLRGIRPILRFVPISLHAVRPVLINGRVDAFIPVPLLIVGYLVGVNLNGNRGRPHVAPRRHLAEHIHTGTQRLGRCKIAGGLQAVLIGSHVGVFLLHGHIIDR